MGIETAPVEHTHRSRMLKAMAERPICSSAPTPSITTVVCTLYRDSLQCLEEGHQEVVAEIGKGGCHVINIKRSCDSRV